MTAKITIKLIEWKAAGYAIAGSLMEAGMQKDVPLWWSRLCEFSCHTIDTVLDLLALRCPLIVKACFRNYVDRWHQELEWGPAPYGWTAFRGRLDRKLADLSNYPSILLRQK